MDASVSQKTFELNNDVVIVDPSVDRVFQYDADQQRRLLNEAPWKKE